MEKYYNCNEIDFYENEKEKIIIYNRLNRSASSIDKDEFIRLLKQFDKNNKLNSLENFNVFSITQKEFVIKILVDSNIVINKSLISKNVNRKIIFNPHQFMNINKTFLKIINYMILYLSLPIFAVGLIIGVLHDELYINFNYSLIEIILFIIPIVIITVFFHELSHAIVAENNGAFVPEMGIKFNMANNFFIPIFYTTIIGRTDLQKNQKISILLAGILINIQFIGFSLMISTFTVGFIHDIFIFIIIIDSLMTISNLTVVFRTDGYFILEEIFEIKNLNQKTLIYIKSIFTKKNSLKFQKPYIVYSIMLLSSVIIYFILLICFVLMSTLKN